MNDFVKSEINVFNTFVAKYDMYIDKQEYLHIGELRTLGDIVSIILEETGDKYKNQFKVNKTEKQVIEEINKFLAPISNVRNTIISVNDKDLIKYYTCAIIIQTVLDILLTHNNSNTNRNLIVNTFNAYLDSIKVYFEKKYPQCKSIPNYIFIIYNFCINDGLFNLNSYCTNCHDCAFCIDCRNCNRCFWCYNCEETIDSFGSNFLESCKKMHECKQCINCENLKACNVCSRSKNLELESYMYNNQVKMVVNKNKMPWYKLCFICDNCKKIKTRKPGSYSICKIVYKSILHSVCEDCVYEAGLSSVS